MSKLGAFLKKFTAVILLIFFRYLSPISSLLLRDRWMRLSWLLIDTQFYCLRHKML